MKNKTIFTIVSILFYVYAHAQTNINDFLNKITIEHISAHIDTLASESMEGRYSGEPGQKLAAQYIANEFSKYGLTPFDPKAANPYYQKFNLYNYQIGESEIYYGNNSYWASIYVGSNSISDSIYGQIIFTGYAKNEGLKILDVNNKSIFFFSESVKGAIEKAKEIANTYTINTFVVGLPFRNNIDKKVFTDSIIDFYSFKEFFYYYNYYVTNHRNTEDFNTLLNKNIVIPNLKINSDKDIKILFVPEDLSGGIFKKDSKYLKKIAGKAKKTKNNNLTKLKPIAFSYMVDYNPIIDSINTENVIGYIDSKLSGQKIIIGAHYDHIGVNENGEINYGADDNASGTAAILIIAQLLKDAVQNGLILTKDIVFVTYSAEELGLHGSQYYVQNPLFPLSETEVLFNLDMIGRDKDDDTLNSNTVYLLNWGGGSDYIKNVQNLNEEYTHLLVDPKPDPKDKTLWTYGSDHYSFAEQGISSIAYFTALHADYHTPGDTPDKLNYDKLSRIIRLVFLNIWDLSIQEN